MPLLCIISRVHVNAALVRLSPDSIDVFKLEYHRHMSFPFHPTCTSTNYIVRYEVVQTDFSLSSSCKEALASHFSIGVTARQIRRSYVRQQYPYNPIPSSTSPLRRIAIRDERNRSRLPESQTPWRMCRRLRQQGSPAFVQDVGQWAYRRKCHCTQTSDLS